MCLLKPFEMDIRAMGGIAIATVGVISTMALIRSLSQNEEVEEKKNPLNNIDDDDVVNNKVNNQTIENTCKLEEPNNHHEESEEYGSNNFEQQQQQQQQQQQMESETKGKKDPLEKLSSLSFSEFDSISPKRQTRADRSLSEALSSHEILVLEGVSFFY